MQAKFLLALLGTFAIASAAATPSAPAADETKVELVIIEESGPLDASIEARAADINWTAKGGCKVDWADRCNAQCRGGM